MILQTANAIFLFITTVSDILSFKGYFLGKSINEVSDNRKTPLTPNNKAFSIWILIFGLSVLFVIYSYLDLMDTFSNIGGLFISLCVLRTLWTIAFCFEFIKLSVILMVLLVGNVSFIYYTINPNYVMSFQYAIFFFYYGLFSIYYAWINVAFFSNLMLSVKPDYDEKTNNESDGISYLSMILIILLSVYTCLNIWFHNDIFYLLTTIWALFWIWVDNHSNGYILVSLVISGILTFATVIVKIILLFI